MLLIEALVLIILVYGFVILLSALIQHKKSADFLIILGSGLEDNKPNKQMIDRLNRAIEYLNSYDCNAIIVTGGLTHNNTISEAEVMKNYLLEKGILKKIIVEDKATNTIENIHNSSMYFQRRDRLVLVSNDYHILRSKMICRMFDYKNVKSISCKTSFKDLLIHIPIEEVFIIIDFFKIKNGSYLR